MENMKKIGKSGGDTYIVEAGTPALDDGFDEAFGLEGHDPAFES